MEQKMTTVKKLFFDCKKIKRLIGAAATERVERIDVTNQDIKQFVKVVSLVKGKEITRLYRDVEFYKVLGVKGQILEFYWNEGGMLGFGKGLQVVTKLEELMVIPDKVEGVN